MITDYILIQRNEVLNGGYYFDNIVFLSWHKNTKYNNIVELRSVSFYTIPGIYVTRVRNLVALSCPSGVYSLSNGCKIAELPVADRPLHSVGATTTCITNGTHAETGNVIINPDGGIRYYGHCNGAYELCFSASYLISN